MPLSPATALTLDDLTLAERAELERAVDGPISPQHIADKLRARSVLSVGAQIAVCRSIIKRAQDSIAYHEQRAASEAATLDRVRREYPDSCRIDGLAQNIEGHRRAIEQRRAEIVEAEAKIADLTPQRLAAE